MSNGGDIVGTAEACEILHYSSISSVTRLVHEGVLTPAHKLPGLRGAFLFHRADVERLAKERAA